MSPGPEEAFYLGLFSLGQHRSLEPRGGQEEAVIFKRGVGGIGGQSLAGVCSVHVGALKAP